MKKEEKFGTKLLLLLVMLALSIVFVAPFVMHGIHMEDDLSFHIERIQELAQNIAHGNWNPHYYTYEFWKMGYPLGVFYPQIMMLPFAGSALMFKSVTSGIYFGIGFYTFITLYVMYFVVNRILQQKTAAFWSAVLYTFSCYRMLDILARFAVGEFIAMVFVPLAFYGLYAVFTDQKRKWLYLPIGLALVLLSHLLTALMVILIMALLVVILLPFVHQRKIKLVHLFKSGLLFSGCSATFLVPFIHEMTYQAIVTPKGNPIDQHIFTIKNIFFSTLINSNQRFGQVSKWNSQVAAYYTIGLVLLLVALLGIFYFKRLKMVSKIALICGSVLYFSTYFGSIWTLLFDTPLRIVQFPYRFFSLVTFGLALVGGNLAELMINSVTRKWLVQAVLAIVIGGTWMWGAHTYYATAGPQQDFATIVPSWRTDQYTPKKAQPVIGQIVHHQARVDGHLIQLKSNEIQSVPDGFVFKNAEFKGAKRVILPICNYAGLKVYQNGYEIPKLVTQNVEVEIQKSKSTEIKVLYRTTWGTILGNLISIITWIFCLVFLFRH